MKTTRKILVPTVLAMLLLAVVSATPVAKASKPMKINWMMVQTAFADNDGNGAPSAGDQITYVGSSSGDISGPTMFIVTIESVGGRAGQFTVVWFINAPDAPPDAPPVVAGVAEGTFVLRTPPSIVSAGEVAFASPPLTALVGAATFSQGREVAPGVAEGTTTITPSK